MRVKAKCWVNYNGVWHKGGEIFNVESEEEVKGLVVVSDDFVSDIFPPEETVEEPKRRGRPRKTED